MEVYYLHHKAPNIFSVYDEKESGDVVHIAVMRIDNHYCEEVFIQTMAREKCWSCTTIMDLLQCLAHS